jgi:nucleotide sugar dehydrogenase
MIGIIGQGFVGNAVYQKFRHHFDVLTYDKYSVNHNSTLENLIDNSKYIFVCLPTPMNTDGSCNTDIIESVLDQITSHTDQERVIIIKSTVICGTTKRLSEKYPTLHFVFNPEFLTERNAVEDYNNQDRIILGGDRPYTTELKQIFSKVFPNAHIIKTDSTHAEMVKYLINTFLSVKVSFANEIYQICEGLKIDYDKVVEYATYDRRLGDSHWNVPGHDGDFGFGGHCFPKDLAALIDLAENLNVIDNVLSAAEQTNTQVRTVKDWEQMKGRAVT